MINSYKHYSVFNNVLKFFILCFVSLMLASCENFLNGKDTKDQLVDTIAYNNAPSNTLIFRTTNDEGDFLTGNEKACKVGYTVDVQFSVNSNNYVFRSLEAVSSVDKTISRSDYVEFTDIGTDHEKNNGVYKIRIKLLKQSNDILIRPVCVLIPRVKQIIPAYSKDGCEQDTSITIEFNKSINPETFDANCLSIKNGEEELFSTNPAESYYEAPVFSNENTILTIPTIKGKYIIPITTAAQNPKDITISIIASTIKDTDGFTLQPVESHTYRINQNIDKEKPEIKSLTTSNTSNTTDWSYRTLTDKSVENWSSATEYETDGTTVKFLNGDYNRNHIADTVHISIQGYDKDSGIKCVKVHRVYEKTAGGADAMQVEEENTFGTGQFVSVQNSDNIYEYSFDYNFATSLNDGLYKLEISVIDKAENESNSLSYYVIKDTDLKRNLKWLGYLDVSYSFKDPLNVDKEDYDITDNCFPSYNEATGKYESKLIFHYFNFIEDNFYSSYKTLCTKLLIQQCNSNNEYITVFEEKNLSNNDIADVDRSNEVIDLNVITSNINESLENLVIDPDVTTKFRVLLYEDNGIINEYPFVITKRPRIFTHEIGTSGSFKFYEEEMDYSISPNISVSLSKSHGIVGKKRDSETEISSYRKLIHNYDMCCDEDKCTYYISYARETTTDSGRIYSAFGKPYELYRKEGTTDSNYLTYIYVPSLITNYNFPDFSFPELNEQNIANGKIEFPPNTGKVRFTIDIAYSGQEDGYDYLFKTYNEGYTLENIFSSNTIEISNGIYYTISLCARNSEGVIVAESDAREIQFIGPNVPDNIPPILAHTPGDYRYYKNQLVIYRNKVNDYSPTVFFTEEDGSQFLDDAYDRVKSMDYYFVPMSVDKTVTRQELENAQYAKYTLAVPEYSSGSSMTIPLYFLEQGEFQIYCYLEDIAGNSSLYRYERIKNNATIPGSIGNYTITVEPEYTVKNEARIYHKKNNEDEPQERIYIYSVTFPKYSDALKPAANAYTYNANDGLGLRIYTYQLMTSSNTWGNPESSSNPSWLTYSPVDRINEFSETFSEDNENYTVTFSEDTGNYFYQGGSYTQGRQVIFENKFFKSEIVYGDGSNGLDVYLCPIYFYRGPSDYNYTCHNKSVIESLNGYQVFLDKPVLAHTMYSKFKFTETNSAEDSHIWEGRGVETGLIYNDASTGSFSYTDENFEAIPAGCYYTTIFHFVDGTTVMTPVKQK